MSETYQEGAANNPEHDAYEFAWGGFQDAEYGAAGAFSRVTEFLPVNPDESGEDDPVVRLVGDGSEMVTEESVVVYKPVDISEMVVSGAKLAVEFARLTTITASTPAQGGTPDMEVVVQDRAAVLDTSFNPPMLTGEEYERQPITLKMTPDGKTITGMHFANPDRPGTYDELLEVREDQRRYIDLLGLVRAARVSRGEITA